MLNKLSFKKTSFFNKIEYCYFFIPLIIIAIILLKELVNCNYLWFDEAGQFFISKGIEYNKANLNNLNNYSIKDVIYMNSHYNHDPGGYSLLLHIWLNISNNIYFARSLNIIIFIINIIILIKLLRCFNLNILQQLLSISLFLTFNSYMVIEMALELRGYMMEIFVVLLGFFIVIDAFIYKDLKEKRLFFSLFILILFMSCRYSAILFTFLVFFVVFFEKKPSIELLILAFLFFIYSYLIIKYSLSKQNPEVKQLYYLHYLNSFNGIKQVIKGNLSYLIGLILLVIVYLKYKKYSKRKVLLFVLLINFTFIMTSILGKYPYLPNSNRGLIFSLITVLMIIVLLLRLLNVLKYSSHILNGLLVVYSFKLFSIESYRVKSTNDFKSGFAILKSASQRDTIYCTFWSGISIKAFDLMSEKQELNLIYQPMPFHNNFSNLKRRNDSVWSDYKLILQSGNSVVYSERNKTKSQLLWESNVLETYE
jgi:hypothetical protein